MSCYSKLISRNFDNLAEQTIQTLRELIGSHSSSLLRPDSSKGGGRIVHTRRTGRWASLPIDSQQHFSVQDARLKFLQLISY